MPKFKKSTGYKMLGSPHKLGTIEGATPLKHKVGGKEEHSAVGYDHGTSKRCLPGGGGDGCPPEEKSSKVVEAARPGTKRRKGGETEYLVGDNWKSGPEARSQWQKSRTPVWTKTKVGA